jgi:thiol-disulfide isomerase/thioredoxin
MQTAAMTATSDGDRPARPTGRRLAILGLLIALGLTGLSACAVTEAPRPAARADVRPGGPRLSAPLAVGDTVPDFVAPGVGGEPVRWRQREGSPTVLVVWAAWCPYCQQLLPSLARVAREFPAVRIVTVTTSIGRRAGPDPADYLTQHRLAFPAALDDADNSLARAMGVSRYPTVFWVGSDGRVRGVSEGAADEAALRGAFRQFAGSP